MFSTISSFSGTFKAGKVKRILPVSGEVASDPTLSLGTTVPWTNNTIWYTAGTSNPGGNFTAAVRPIIQVMYAHQAIKVSSGATTSLGIYASQVSGGTWRWQFSVSTVANTIGSFSTPTFISALIGQSNVTGGVTYTGVTNVEFSIPAKRYFLVIRSPGPLYTASTANPGNGGINRTATIGGTPVFTTLSYSLVGDTTSVTNAVTNLPTQLGGTDSGYWQQNNYNPAFGITFTIT